MRVWDAEKAMRESGPCPFKIGDYIKPKVVDGNVALRTLTPVARMVTNVVVTDTEVELMTMVSFTGDAAKEGWYWWRFERATEEEALLSALVGNWD